jgi:hypothetical protein
MQVDGPFHHDPAAALAVLFNEAGNDGESPGVLLETYALCKMCPRGKGQLATSSPSRPSTWTQSRFRPWTPSLGGCRWATGHGGWAVRARLRSADAAARRREPCRPQNVSRRRPVGHSRKHLVAEPEDWSRCSALAVSGALHTTFACNRRRRLAAGDRACSVSIPFRLSESPGTSSASGGTTAVDPTRCALPPGHRGWHARPAPPSPRRPATRSV